MMLDLATALVSLLVGSVPGPHQTYTTPLVPNDTDVVVCLAQNVGTLPVTVTAALHAANGSISAGDTLEVPPGRSLEFAQSAPGNGGYCAFTFDADPETLRGFILRRLPGGDTKALFPAFSVRRGMVGSQETTTPPLRSIGDEQIGCMLQNLSDEEVEVETELIDADGSLIDASTDQIMPGRFGVVRSSPDNHLGAYCRFTVTENGDEVRGYSLLFLGTQNTAHLVFPATTAQPVGGLTTWTPPVSSLAGDATSCAVQSLDTLALIVDAELVDADGTVLDSGSAMVMPGRVATVAGHTEAGTNAVCRFTFDDSDDRVRAFITRYPPGLFKNTDLLALAAAPGGLAERDMKTYSPPVRIGNDGFLQCAAVNLTDADIPVRYEINDGDGSNVAMVDTDVPAGRGKGASTTNDLSDAICTFEFDGSPRDLRGFATLTNDTAQRTEVVFAAAPAGPPPTATPTGSPTVTPTRTSPPTRTPTATATATSSATSTATATQPPTPTATSSPSATATHTPSAVPSATVASTVTASPPPSPTPTGAPTTPPPGPCVGDCNGDGTVSIDELITLVNIGLGAPLATCPAGDRNGDGTLSIDELVTAVGNALDGC